MRIIISFLLLITLRLRWMFFNEWFDKVFIYILGDHMTNIEVILFVSEVVAADMDSNEASNLICRVVVEKNGCSALSRWAIDLIHSKSMSSVFTLAGLNKFAGLCIKEVNTSNHCFILIHFFWVTTNEDLVTCQLLVVDLDLR